MSKKEKGYLVVCDKKYLKALKKAYKKTNGADNVSKGVFNTEYLLDTFNTMFKKAEEEAFFEKPAWIANNHVEFNPKSTLSNKERILELLNEFRKWNREWTAGQTNHPTNVLEFADVLATKYKVDTVDYKKAEPANDDPQLTVTIKHQDKSCGLMPEYWIKVNGLEPLKFELHQFAVEAISMYMRDKSIFVNNFKTINQ